MTYRVPAAPRAFFTREQLEAMCVPDRPVVGPVTMGWDLAEQPSLPAVVVIEKIPEGMLIREALVGDDAIEYLQTHHPEALADDAPRAGHATLKRLEDIQ